MTHRFLSRAARSTAFLLVFVTSVHARDWPMWRHDPQRSGSTTHKLPDELHLQWVRTCPPPRMAELADPKLQYDQSLEPIVMGKTLFVGSSSVDTLTALDTETGAVKWVFFAEGPIRFAPVGWKDRIYFVSDDGYLYCLRAADGSLVWKFRGAPTDRKVLGTGRLVSAWPCRGGPVLDEGRIYFAAGVWPFMGTFIYCIDVETGKVIWVNEEEKTGYNRVAPLGYLVVSGGKLIVPCGRSLPAIFDRNTGKLLVTPYVMTCQTNPRWGGSHVFATDEYFYSTVVPDSSGALFDLNTGRVVAVKQGGARRTTYVPPNAIVSNGVLYGDWLSNESLIAIDLKHARVSHKEGKVRYGRKKGAKRVFTVLEAPTLWSYQQWPSLMRYRKMGYPFGCGVKQGSVTRYFYIRNVVAASCLYSGRAGHLFALDISGKKPVPVWKTEVDGIIGSIIAADDRLFVITQSGKMYCYGRAKKSAPKQWPGAARSSSTSNSSRSGKKP